MRGATVVATAGMACVILACSFAIAAEPGTNVVREAEIASYPDGRPAARYRLDAKDHGVVFQHGRGPGQCDRLGARDVWVWQHEGTYYMHYDGAGPKGWRVCRAVSKDLLHWRPEGPVLDFGKQGEHDSASASYGVVYREGATWHMFYLGAVNTSPAPNLVPALPYVTMKAVAASPTGPWMKQPKMTPLITKAGTYYSGCTSPGQVIKNGDEYVMSFAASTYNPVLRTLSFARARSLDGPWTPDPKPILPSEEQIENSSLYFEKANRTWFLFTNHVALRDGEEYTDAIWVYWTKDLNRWDAARKAVVLDPSNCKWSKRIVGLPSTIEVGGRLALFYDGSPADTMSHMHRDVGLAWLDLPLVPPASVTRERR